MARKSSVISINDFVEDAAKQFDQLTDGSDFSLDDHEDNEERNEKPRYAGIRFKSRQDIYFGKFAGAVVLLSLSIS